jgi:hypothetical protein
MSTHDIIERRKKKDEWDNHPLSIRPAPGRCCPDMHVICSECGHDFGMLTDALEKCRKEQRETDAKIIENLNPGKNRGWEERPYLVTTEEAAEAIRRSK